MHATDDCRPVAALIGWHEVPVAPGHVFYNRLNALLDEAGFDGRVEELCAAHYAVGVGRPSVPPGCYFRMLFVGYFEGLPAQLKGNRANHGRGQRDGHDHAPFVDVERPH
jgi:hypothetical protein